MEDIIVDNRQALEMSQIHSDLLKSSMDAFASLISTTSIRL